MPMLFVLPQCSILGPNLFTIYPLPLDDIVRAHNVHLHMQMIHNYILLLTDEILTIYKYAKLSQIEDSLSDVRRWLAVNLLKLNDFKTEFC